MSTRIASRRLVENLPISRPSQYICRACRQTTPISQQRRHASDDSEPKSFLEKTRGKLWKGKPPGPENINDVYGGPGFFAEMKEERRAARNRRRQESKDSIPVEERFTPKPQVSEITEEESVFSKPAQTQAEFIERAGEAQSEVAVTTKGGDTVKEAAEIRQGPLAAEVKFWEGLEVIGHQGDWKEMPAMPADDYTPWQKMDKDLKWTRNELISLMAIAAEDGQMVEQTYFPGDASLSQLSEEARSTLLSRPLEFHGKSGSTLKLLSRFSYLSRRRIPDPVLTKISRKSSTPTIEDFLDMFDAKTKPRPTKIAEILMSTERLGAHANLLVFDRKENMIDKEQEIGRWKVIEAELRHRELPIPGQPIPRRLHGFERKSEAGAS